MYLNIVIEFVPKITNNRIEFIFLAKNNKKYTNNYIIEYGFILCIIFSTSYSRFQKR